MTDAFQVDLRGVVDLLARHLYSSPRVYLRELLQNGVDAVTARRATDPGAPARIRLRPLPGGGLEVRDTGVGLTSAEARELLATIGRSSKRDVETGSGRSEFLGQFGIGLLSAFLVADEIELVSRSARAPGSGDAPPAVRWRGRSDGRYELVELAPDDPSVPAEPGSVVTLHPRPDMEHWLAPETVTALALDVGSLLPVDLAIEVPLDEGGTAWRRLSGEELPWRAPAPSAAARTSALAAYAERTLGFAPLAHLDLEVPLAGVSGVAYVLPSAVSPTTAATHRVYLKRMLLGTKVDDLLPPWAFFVRCVLDASALRPTASREGLYEDEVLLATREALGAQVRAWCLATLAEDTVLRRRFLETHHLAVRALAVQDDEMLDLAARVLPFETTEGTATLAELAELPGARRVLYTTTVEEFRRVAPVAAAQGLVVVNGGYVYDADLLARAARRFPTWFPGLGLAPVTTDDVAQVLVEVDPLRELEIAHAVTEARSALDAQDCDVVVRSFEPEALPAMLLDDREGEHLRAAQATAQEADDLWGAVLAGLSEPARPRRLVLNDANPTVRALLAGAPGDVPEDVRGAGVRSLYVTALLASGRPLEAREAVLMNDALAHLLDRALRTGPDTTRQENR